MAAKIPNYKRQKFLLLLIKIAGGRLWRTDLQKLLFLATRGQTDPHYDFVPYRFGCYSFQAAEDLEILQRLGWLSISGTEVSLTEQSLMKTGLPISEIEQLSKTLGQYNNLRGKRLVRVVYRKYPYFAINSEIAKEILGEEHYNSVLHIRRRLRQKATVLFTIGYEGLSFESYINKLIQNDVRLLCDVRQNPLSRKFGFSKKILSTVLPNLGVNYIHIPELGVASEHRTGLETQAEFHALFKSYRAQLSGMRLELEKLKELLENNRRMALTCFEKHHSSCHRHCLSDNLSKHNNIAVVHL